MGDYLTSREAADVLRVREHTVRAWRSRGIGPAYVRTPTGRIRYRRAELDRWMTVNR